MYVIVQIYGEKLIFLEEKVQSIQQFFENEMNLLVENYCVDKFIIKKQSKYKIQ